jgi:signal transduction histidine kinase
VPGPVAGDVLVALAVAVGAGLVDVLGAADRVDSAPLWDIALAAPLVLRRRRPAHAFALISLVCLAQWLAGVEVSGDVAFLLALFSVAAYGRRWPTLIAAITIAELGVAMAFLRWGSAHHWLLPALTAAGTVSACWIMGIYMRMRSDYIASIQELAETAERERDSQARVAVAAERSRIAREMHDVIAHSLSVMITLNDAAAAVEPTPRGIQTIMQASEVGRNALEDMQRLLGVLREDESPDPEHAPQPGVAEIPALISTVRASGLSVHLAMTGDLTGIPTTAQLALYRIIQESLTNVLKHAHKVRNVRVELLRDADTVGVVVVDDGASTIERPTTHPEGHGLEGMEERARIFGGQLSAGPGRTGGWSVRAVLHIGEVAR